MTRIKLPYIQEFIDQETGQVHRYFRRKLVRIRLPGTPGSAEFMEVYKSALAGTTATTKVSKIHKAGSVGDLITNYLSSPEFGNLGMGSKRRYRGVLSRFGDAHGHRDVNDLPILKARKIIQDIGAEKPGMANFTKSVLTTLFEFAISIEMRREEKGNPFRRIKAYKGGTHHTWTDAELAAYRKRWPLGTIERLAFAATFYTDQRISDVVRMIRPPKAIGDALAIRRADALTIKQRKTGKELVIPVHPALARAMDAGPTNGPYLVPGADGKPMGVNVIGKLIVDAAQAAGLPRYCTAHGLRKAMQRLLAELGATDKQMRAVSGHKSPRETERYSEMANQALLAAAAISLVPDETDGEQEVSSSTLHLDTLVGKSS